MVSVTIQEVTSSPTKTIVDGIPMGTPSTVVDTDDQSTGSSVGSSASGRRNPFNKGKKPRAEYQKKIDALKKWKTNLKEENDLHKEDFAKLKSWIMSAPMPGVKLVDLTDGEDEAEISTPETAKNRKLFGKKPRAEFQQEIDDLEAANTQLTADNDRLKELISELRVWHCDIPV